MYGGSRGKVNSAAHHARFYERDAASCQCRQSETAPDERAPLAPGDEESPAYLIAPTVKPAMKRSTKKLYRRAMGTLAMKEPAISEPQK